MTEHELDKDLRDSLKKDQLEGVDIRVRVPRAIWVECMRAMKVYRIAHVSEYLSNLVRHDAEIREAREKAMLAQLAAPNGPGRGYVKPEDDGRGNQPRNALLKGGRVQE